jgi:hypothetical protein
MGRETDGTCGASGGRERNVEAVCPRVLAVTTWRESLERLELEAQLFE